MKYLVECAPEAVQFYTPYALVLNVEAYIRKQGYDPKKTAYVYGMYKDGEWLTLGGHVLANK